MLVKRPVALAVLAAGLVVAGAGGAGLALTRHPVATIYPAAAVLPAPTGPIAAVPEQGAVQVSPPVALTIPSIGVQTSLVDLGLTATGALQVPPSTAVAGWYTGSPRPGAVGSAVIAGHIDSAVTNRRQQVDLDTSAPVPDGGMNPEAAAMNRQQEQLAVSVLKAISRRDREILTRFYLDEQSQEQICQDMSLTETQFRLLKSRAKARFGELGKRRLSRRNVPVY